VTSVGLLCALALVPLALLAPLYQGETASEGGVVSATTGTLVGVNGYAVLIPVCVPLVLALAGWIGLRRRCSRGSRVGTLLARSAASLLAVFAVIASASIGLFVLPAALLLILGTTLTPDGRAVGR
jgi:energy-converting hydrogenase Eha subunit B